MPRDTNPYGTIFGGVILSYIDQAGFVEARSHGGHKWVTVALDRVEFTRPVHLGDIICCYTTASRIGTTSITIRVEVEAERFDEDGGGRRGDVVPVTQASITLVSVDDDGRPVPFRAAP
jgi:acyl-CoA thioesterase YciA